MDLSDISALSIPPSQKYRGNSFTTMDTPYYIAKSAWHPVVHLVGTEDVVLLVLALAGQTNSATTQRVRGTPCQPLEVGHSARSWWGDATARAGYATTTTTTTSIAVSRGIG